MFDGTFLFMFLFLISVAAWLGGFTLGRRTETAARLGLFAGCVVLFVWISLLRRPSLAVHVLPVTWLAVLEGTAGAVLFLWVLGLLYARSQKQRDRRVTLAAISIGLVYLVHGGQWMLQDTPRASFGTSVTPVVMQSQNYSCVAASSATALNRMGIATTEMEMAQLTQTRPGTGSTLMRAVAGLNDRLRITPYEATVIEPTLEEMRGVPTPAVAPLRLEVSRLHMVTIDSVDDWGVLVLDPTQGMGFYSWEEWQEIAAGPVIVFVEKER